MQQKDYGYYNADCEDLQPYFISPTADPEDDAERFYASPKDRISPYERFGRDCEEEYGNE